MNKISINLNPQKKDISADFLRNLTVYTPLMGLATIIIFFSIVLLQIFALNRAHSYNVYKKKWKEWEDKFNLINALKKEISDLEASQEKLNKLIAPKCEAALISEDIFSSLPKNIWFESLNLKEGSLDLSGYVVKWDEDYLVSLDNFVNSLIEKSYFSSKFTKVNIRDSKKTEFNGVEVLKFTIECKK